MPDKLYVIISACRNESAYVDGLIDCIAAQEIRPFCWIIVDDGSTDDTASRVLKRSADLPFIRLEKMPGGRPRTFSSQVYAVQHAHKLLQNMEFNFIGLLDADIRVSPEYYATLMAHFEADPKLGLCGGAVIDQHPGGRVTDLRRGSEDYHVAGGVQFFRRECFDRIGGHLPIEGGGQDTIADIMTMMYGWQVRVFPSLRALHLRPDGVSQGNFIKKGMKWGKKFYLIGYHPAYYFAQCARRFRSPPFLLMSLAMLWGFFWANVQHKARPVSPDFVRFLRRLQMQRLLHRTGLRPGAKDALSATRENS